MQNENTSRTRLITFSGSTLGFITFIVFLILKLTNNWDIDWFWVFFPLWLPFAIWLLFMIFAIAIVLIVNKMEGNE